MGGTRAGQPYEHVAEIASGGMGRVDLVVRRQGRFARPYAMKRLHPNFEQDAGVRASFLEEARIAGLIRNVHVVSVLDIGTDDRGAWLVMELVEGLSLAQLLERLGRRGTRLPVPLCLEIARQAALGLQAAHELTGSGDRPLGVIHRDVSPQNILLGFDGIVRLTDFGVARAVDRAVQTRVGARKGKLGYMSPEQLELRSLDQRSDLYSLGVVLFEMLAGVRLRKGDSERVVEQVLHGPPPDIAEYRPDLPPSLVELLFELLARDPSLRPHDASTVARRLADAAGDLDTDEQEPELAAWLAERFGQEQRAQRRRFWDAIGDAAQPPPPAPAAPAPETPAVGPGRTAAAANRGRWRMVLAAGAVLAAAGGAAWVVWTGSDGAAPEPSVPSGARGQPAATADPVDAGADDPAGSPTVGRDRAARPARSDPIAADAAASGSGAPAAPSEETAPAAQEQKKAPAPRRPPRKPPRSAPNHEAAPAEQGESTIPSWSWD